MEMYELMFWQMIKFSFITVIINIVLFFLFRPILCWYFKINDTLDVLTQIRNLLTEQKEPAIEDKLEISSANIDKPMTTLGESRWTQPK